MQTKRFTQINIYHTPLKSPKPDIANQSHLRTTIPSLDQSQQKKSYNQFGVHQSKIKNYDFSNSTAFRSQMRPSKNLWQLKEKVQQYQTQIKLLNQYLKNCQCHCVQKNSISRIFGFQDNKGNLANEEQKVIKQLGTKVRNLIKQNNSLKSLSYNDQSDIEQIIQQNTNLRILLEKYKKNESMKSITLAKQNDQLKIKNQKLQEELEYKSTQLKALMIKNKTKFGKLELQELIIPEQQQRSKLQLIDNKNTLNNQQNKYKINQKLQQSQRKWQEKYQLQENQYLKIKKQLQILNEKSNNIQDVDKLKDYYINIIESIQKNEKQQFEKFYLKINNLFGRIQKADKLIQHLKFQRTNRFHSTFKKTRNVALLSPKPKGQSQIQPQIEQQNIKNKQFQNYDKNNVQVIALKQKIQYLSRQLDQAITKLNLTEKICSQKTQRIINLQNQLRNAKQEIQALNNMNQKQVMYREIAIQVPVIQEIIKQVPVIHQVIKQVPVIQQVIKQIPIKSHDYSQEVKSIKQGIISCNISNFDVFQTQFNQILEQRNKMNNKLQALKRQAKQSSKSLILEKNLKIQKQKNKKLEQNLKKYENQIEDLKIQIIKLQNQIQTVQTQRRVYSQQQFNESQEQQLPNGQAGLQWQKVVKHCLLASINRLQNLQNKMREQKQQQ